MWARAGRTHLLCTLSAVSMTELVPVVSVASTAAVAILTLIINALTKRGDRKHATELKRLDQKHAIDIKREDQEHEIDQDFNKLFGQDKRNALQPLIAATWFVKRQALLSKAPPSDRHYPRAIPIRALDLYVDKLGGENVLVNLLAYATPSVEEAVNAMLSQRDAQWEIHDMALAKLGEIGREWDQIAKGVWQAPAGVTPAVTSAERLAQLHDLRHEALREIEDQAHGFDVNLLVDQCEVVITAARDDFQRGRHGT